MRSISVLIFFLVLSGCCYGVPQDSIFHEVTDTIAFKKKFSESSKNLTSLESDFKQIKVSDMLTIPVISKGKFCYRNTAQVRWEYFSPFTYVIVISNGKLMVKDEDGINSFDLSSNKAFLDLNNLLTSIMNGNIVDQHSGFSVTFRENEKQYLAELKTAKGVTENFFSSVSVYFNRSDCTVESLIITDLSGDRTEIIFENKKINQPIADEKFIVR